MQIYAWCFPGRCKQPKCMALISDAVDECQTSMHSVQPHNHHGIWMMMILWDIVAYWCPKPYHAVVAISELLIPITISHGCGYQWVVFDYTNIKVSNSRKCEKHPDHNNSGLLMRFEPVQRWTWCHTAQWTHKLLKYSDNCKISVSWIVRDGGARVNPVTKIRHCT